MRRPLAERRMKTDARPWGGVRSCRMTTRRVMPSSIPSSDRHSRRKRSAARRRRSPQMAPEETAVAGLPPAEAPILFSGIPYTISCSKLHTLSMLLYGIKHSLIPIRFFPKTPFMIQHVCIHTYLFSRAAPFILSFRFGHTKVIIR